MTKKQDQANYFNWQKIGWRYFHSLKKKAVEQEFSWSGLALTLSIAFFIVIISAQGLNLVYQSMSNNLERDKSLNDKIYRLEKVQHLNTEVNQEFIKKVLNNASTYA